jgi:hypothetical protein
MNRDVVRQLVNLLAVLATIVVNLLANALPINGQTTGEISDRFSVYFVPAGYVFSIWGLIYVGLVAFAIHQVLPSQRESASLRRIGYWFALGSLANMAWIFLWHYELFPATLVAMAVLLLSLIAIYLRLDIGRVPVAAGERWLVHIPFSIYLGWIAVATIANVTAVLAYWRWDGWGIGPELWTVIMLVVGGALAVAALLTRRDAAYSLVAIWAFAGITVKNVTTITVATASALVALIVALVLVVQTLRRTAPA